MLSVRHTTTATLLNLNSAAAKCHWSYLITCCFWMTKWRTSTETD